MRSIIPYGTTSYQANNAAVKACAKRYRYTGKERDEESGLYYHGARYYIPWLGRWTASDPKEDERVGLSPYDYCSNNPINRTDMDGMQDKKHNQNVPSQTNSSDSKTIQLFPPLDGNKMFQFIPPPVLPQNATTSSNSNSKEQEAYHDNSSPQNGGIGLTLNQMKKIFPAQRDKKGKIHDNTEILKLATYYINKYGKEFGLDNKNVLKHFLAQAGVETGYFQTFNATENLNYSVKNINAIFSKYFTRESGRQPAEYAFNPAKFANVTYSNRMGNGPENTGDGWKYRGRGVLQLTGKGNSTDKKAGYTAFTTFYQNRFRSSLDFVANPDIISNTPEISVISGLWYFQKNVDYSKLNNSPQSVRYSAYRVNKGYNGIDERQKTFIEILKIIGN